MIYYTGFILKKKQIFLLSAYMILDNFCKDCYNDFVCSMYGQT